MPEFKSPDFEVSSGKEWLVTNGLGSYASSTIPGTNTRRYHGLLVASLNPPAERKAFVSKVDEIVYLAGKKYRLSTNQYEDIISPKGYELLSGFERNPFPVSHFKFGNASLKKTIFMVHQSNTTVVEYHNNSNSAYILRLFPFYLNRDFHSLYHETPDHDYFIRQGENFQVIYAYFGAEPVYLNYGSGRFTEDRHWHKNICYNIEKSRGMSFKEDVFCTGYIECEMPPGGHVHLVFSLEEKMMKEKPEGLKTREIERLKSLGLGYDNTFLRDLVICGDQFRVCRKSTGSFSVIAGYHWFADWGRDAMIAIRGLYIATGKQEEARSVINTFLSYLEDGIIPNRFPDYKGDKPEYNTIDATLWLFIAVYEYDLKFSDTDFLKQVYPKLLEIIVWHINGTKNNIRVNSKGFLSGGHPWIQLTWMDARIREHVFTPRNGCQVEINALWYNALKIYEHVASRIGYSQMDFITRIKEKFEKNFAPSFFNDNGYLNDVISSGAAAVDSSIRPNQIYAVSLPFPLLPEDKEKQVVENVGRHLLTSYGLRTLDVEHSGFKEEFSGDTWSRDAAYHQGTVWPFLLPEYFIAYLKVHKHSEPARKMVSEHLSALKHHFYSEQCLYGISEVFDGLEPKEGKGCINQAWSVSNMIMLLLKGNIEV